MKRLLWPRGGANQKSLTTLALFLLAFWLFYDATKDPKRLQDEKEEEKDRGGRKAPFQRYPKVDRRKRSEASMLDELEAKLVNVPVKFLDENRETNFAQRSREMKDCGKFPHLYELKINTGDDWQELKTQNGSYYFYRAYFDDRPLEKHAKPAVIRLLGMFDNLTPTRTIFCQFWFEGVGDPAIEAVVESRLIWIRGWGNFKADQMLPYLFTCPLPEGTDAG